MFWTLSVPTSGKPTAEREWQTSIAVKILVATEVEDIPSFRFLDPQQYFGKTMLNCKVFFLLCNYALDRLVMLLIMQTNVVKLRYYPINTASCLINLHFPPRLHAMVR